MSPLIILVLWNTVWAAVLAMVIYALSLTSPFRHRPTILHLLWFGVLLRLIVPSLVQVPILPNLEQPPLLPGEPVAVLARSDDVDDLPPKTAIPIVLPDLSIAEEFIVSDAPARPFELSLAGMSVAISLIGTLVLLTICLCRGRRLVRLLSESHASPPRFVELTERLAHRMNIPSVPRVRLVNGLATPSIWVGWRHSTILLPQHLVDTLDDGQWSCILSHELAHLARRDHWFNLVAAGIMHLLWWNPIAWWAWREMQAHQEACCDAIAISRERLSRRMYAETLLFVLDSWNPKSHVQSHVLLTFGTGSALTRRFEMIANASVRPRTTSVAMVCLALWAVSFVCLPVRAEKQEQQGGASFAQQKTRSSPAADDVNQSPKNSPVLLTAPFDAARARIVQKAWAKRLGKPSPVERNSIGMELILIPPGKFTMGSPVAENGRKEDETQVEVTLTKAFYIGKTEVTQAQWHVVIGTAPWKGEPAHISQGVNFPATNVSWDDAQAFCTKLSKKENATYRLPTEAEWEYACRAGTTTRFYSGDDESTLANYEWCGGVVGQTQEVGLKQANPFGLHDMHGNVWERCQDVYLQNHPGGTDPLVSTGGSQRTFRGGIWSMNSDTARSAHRRWLQPVDLDNALGFRVVRISDK